MADVATPSAIAMSTINAGSEGTSETPAAKAGKTEKQDEATSKKTSEAPAARVGKPEKPDDASYKNALSEAEKGLDASQEKFVSDWERSVRSF